MYWLKITVAKKPERSESQLKRDHKIHLTKEDDEPVSCIEIISPL